MLREQNGSKIFSAVRIFNVFQYQPGRFFIILFSLAKAYDTAHVQMAATAERKFSNLPHCSRNVSATQFFDAEGTKR